MQPFDFIKRNINQKLTCKINFISQINGGFIMFFRNLRARLFKLVASIVNNMERINLRKKDTTNVVSLQSVKVTFILFECHRSIDNSNDIYLFILS